MLQHCLQLHVEDVEHVHTHTSQLHKHHFRHCRFKVHILLMRIFFFIQMCSWVFSIRNFMTKAASFIKTHKALVSRHSTGQKSMSYLFTNWKFKKTAAPPNLFSIHLQWDTGITWYWSDLLCYHNNNNNTKKNLAHGWYKHNENAYLHHLSIAYLNIRNLQEVKYGLLLYLHNYKITW